MLKRIIMCCGWLLLFNVWTGSACRFGNNCIPSDRHLHFTRRLFQQFANLSADQCFVCAKRQLLSYWRGHFESRVERCRNFDKRHWNLETGSSCP